MALGTVNTYRPRAIFLSLLDLLSFTFFDECFRLMFESIRFIMQTCPDFYLSTNDRLSKTLLANLLFND